MLTLSHLAVLVVVVHVVAALPPQDGTLIGRTWSANS